MAPLLGLVAAVLALYAPLRAAAQASPATQTLTLYAAVCALVGCVAVLAAFERRQPAPAALLGVGALAGALTSLLFVRQAAGLDTAADPTALHTRLLIIAPIFAAGVWALVACLRRLVEGPRRPAALAAVILTALTVLGPRLVGASSLTANNLSEITMRTVVLYWTVGGALVTLPLLALTTVPGDWFERWWDAAARRVMAPSNRAFAIGLVAATFVLTAGFSWYCFGGRPITSDEIAQLWHARILLSGHLALPPDPNPEFFAIDNIIDNPLWMSQFPIGGPAIQVLGVAVGVTWLTNPIFTGLTALNVYRFVQRAYGEAEARAASAVFIASPMVLIMGGSHMNHMATAWLVTLALAALPLWLRADDARARWRAAMVIGLGVGTAATIRPLDAVIAATLLGSVMLAVTARERQRAASLVPGIAAGAVPVALLLWANWVTTGAPLRFGYQVLWGPNHSLGLHTDPTGLPHTIWRALLMALRYLGELNGFATTWPAPILLVVALGFAFAPAVRRWDVLLLACCALQLAAYTFYWHDGQFAGPRFFFTAIPALLILAARAPFMLSARELGGWRRAVWLLIPASIGAAWVRPMGPFGVQGMASEYRSTRTSLKFAAPSDSIMDRLPRSLVFVQEHANARLVRRLWALGVSRPDAARWLRDADACSLFEAARAEEARGAADTAGRKERIERGLVRFSVPGMVPSSDTAFRADLTRAINSCLTELANDRRVLTFISYGPFLLRNRLNALGRIDGQVVYAMDLTGRNELLRARFGDREWYRWEVPRDAKDSVPVLVPYDSAARAGRTR